MPRNYDQGNDVSGVEYVHGFFEFYNLSIDLCGFNVRMPHKFGYIFFSHSFSMPAILIINLNFLLAKAFAAEIELCKVTGSMLHK